MNTGKTLFAQIMDFLPWSTFDRILQENSVQRTGHWLFDEKEPLIADSNDEEERVGCSVMAGRAPSSRRRRNQEPHCRVAHRSGVHTNRRWRATGPGPSPQPL